MIKDSFSVFSALLKKLCTVVAGSNFEDEMRLFLQKETAALADDFFVDPTGSVYILKKGVRSGPPAVVWNRLDEPAFMVQEVNTDGTFSFTSIDDRVPPSAVAGKVLFLPRSSARAFVPLRAIHVTPKSQRNDIPEMASLFGELGTDTKEETSPLAQPGDIAVFDTPYQRLGKSGVSGRCVGGRIGCAIALRLMREKPERDTWFVFGAKSEISSAFSAQLAAKRLAPAYAICFEEMAANDYPSVAQNQRLISLRKGACLYGGMPFNKNALLSLRTWAEKQGLPCQLVFEGRYRAFSAMAEGGKGCSVLGVGVPERHARCAFPIADLADALAAEQLIREALKGNWV